MLFKDKDILEIKQFYKFHKPSFTNSEVILKIEQTIIAIHMATNTLKNLINKIEKWEDVTHLYF